VRYVCLPILALCFFASPVLAWNEAGHQLTAVIAFDLLSEAQPQHVSTILRAHPRFREDFVARMPNAIANAAKHDQARWLFAQASIWPDIIQGLGEEIRDRYHYGTWHYVNLPVYLTDQDRQEFESRLDHNVSAEFIPPLRKYLNIMQALQGNLLVWRDDTASDAERAVALSWILHLAGDIHEPLHVVALFSSEYFPEGDRGGNLIAVRREDDVTNLHAVWDGLANYLDEVTPDDQTREMLATDVVDLRSISDWARDQHQLAMAFGYTDEVKRKLLAHDAREGNPEISLSSEYLNTAEEIARSRIIIAGHRIAALLAN
jgi:hypothetical protein